MLFRSRSSRGDDRPFTVRPAWAITWWGKSTTYSAAGNLKHCTALDEAKVELFKRPENYTTVIGEKSLCFVLFAVV